MKDRRRIAVKRLRGVACHHVLARSDVATAIGALHRISDDSQLLTEAAVPYIRDKKRPYRQQAAKLLAEAGADLVKARIWGDPPAASASGLRDQRG